MHPSCRLWSHSRLFVGCLSVCGCDGLGIDLPGCLDWGSLVKDQEGHAYKLPGATVTVKFFAEEKQDILIHLKMDNTIAIAVKGV